MEITRLDPETFDWTRGTGGADAVRRIAEAAAAYDGRASLNEAAVLTLQTTGLGGGLLLLAGDPDPVGFAYGHGLVGSGHPELDLVVDPAARGRGVASALVAEVEGTLSGLAVTAWSHGHHPAAAALAARTGFRPVRELWLMRRRSELPLPAASQPAGYRVRPFRPGADDAAFLAVNAATFASHPEQGDLDEAGLTQRIAQDWFDADGFLVAEPAGGAGEEVAGFHWTKLQAEPPPACGEVYVIGVAPSAQGTGLGRYLLHAGLEHLHGRGVAEVVLYVEADNAPAIRLYDSYGFTHEPRDTDVLYARGVTMAS